MSVEAIDPRCAAIDAAQRYKPLRASRVVEAYDRVIEKLEIRDDESNTREEFAGVVLHFRHDPPRLRPTSGRIRGLSAVRPG